MSMNTQKSRRKRKRKEQRKPQNRPLKQGQGPTCFAAGARADPSPAVWPRSIIIFKEETHSQCTKTMYRPMYRGYYQFTVRVSSSSSFMELFFHCHIYYIVSLSVFLLKKTKKKKTERMKRRVTCACRRASG